MSFLTRVPDLHADHASIARFVGLLHRTIGLDAASIGASAIERAVRERFAAWRDHGQAGATLDDYWHAVNAEAQRLQDLIEAVVVPETWFFRDAEAFAALARLAKVKLLDRPGKPVRVLSVPCSSGEEPYSAAMAMIDAGIAPERFSIDALDVSETALARARHAHYGRNAFRGHALAFRDRHFERAADGWRLGPEVAARVRFAQANLLQLDPYAFERFDFVFCRNVLIYFDRATQHAALDVLERLLADDGTLFVGPAETGLLMREGMTSAKIALAFAFHRTRDGSDPSAKAVRHAWAAGGAFMAHFAATAATATATATAAVTDARVAFPVPPGSVPPAQAFVTSAFDTTRLAALAQVRVPNVGGRLPAGAAGESLAHVRLAATVDVSGSAPGRTPAAAFAPRTVSVPPAASAAPAPAPLGRGPLARNLDEAHTLADAGNLDAAAVAARAYLAAHPSSASAYYLLGLIADARGVTPEARTHYKRALYLDPAHREALTHLAAVLELDGDEAGARLLLARADRVVKHGGRDE